MARAGWGEETFLSTFSHARCKGRKKLEDVECFFTFLLFLCFGRHLQRICQLKWMRWEYWSNNNESE